MPRAISSSGLVNGAGTAGRFSARTSSATPISGSVWLCGGCGGRISHRSASRAARCTLASLRSARSSSATPSRRLPARPQRSRSPGARSALPRRRRPGPRSRSARPPPPLATKAEFHGRALADNSGTCTSVGGVVARSRTRASLNSTRMASGNPPTWIARHDRSRFCACSDWAHCRTPPSIRPAATNQRVV